MRIRLFLFPIIVLTASILAQPLIVVVPEVLEFDEYTLASTFFHGLPGEPIYIKNTGVDTVELGLSVECAYRVVDSIEGIRDSIRFRGYFFDTLSYPPISDSLDYILESPRFCSDGFYGASGLSLAPGDSVFLSYDITTHCCPSMPMEDTSHVYIYARSGAEIDTAEVTQYFGILSPPGFPPPESLVIDSINAILGYEQVFLSTTEEPWELCLDYYHLYRDTIALFFASQLDSNNLLPDRFYTTTLVDSFSDTLWEDYWMSSKGVGDTLVNLFYVATGVDTGMGGYGESSSPGWCVCEYDQGMKVNPVLGSFNLLSIPCYDERYTTASDLSEFAVSTVQEWNPVTQTWSLHGKELLPGVWSPDEPLQVSHVYRVSGTDMEPTQLFSTFKPGIVPNNDSTYILYSNSIMGDRNIIMLPFKTSLLDGISNCSTLDASISGVGATIYQVDRWNNATQTWEIIGTEAFPDTWIVDGRLRPGLPYRIWVDTDSPVTWPISAR